jgi:hypothetical protein
MLSPSLPRAFPLSRAVLAGLILLATALPGRAAVAEEALRVLPEEAIPFTAFLRKTDFDRRFPGDKVASVGDLEPGWYVSYEHEALRYHFGPILLESTGQDYRAELESIVEDAVAQRPSITGYTIDLSYLPPPAAEPPPGEPGPGESSPPAPAPPQPRQSFNLFDLIRRIFGF